MRHKLKFVVAIGICTLCLADGITAQDILGQEVGKIPLSATGVYALENATVHVGDGQVIDSATVIVAEGLISSVGSNMNVPVEAFVIDASGLHVYPGIIDALTRQGLKKGDSPGGDTQQAGRRGAASGQNEVNPEGPGLNAHLQAAANLVDDMSRLESWRDAGITSLHVAPDEGVFQGQTALINVTRVGPRSVVIATPIAMKMSSDGLGFRTYPGSLMGVIAHIKQSLLDAQHYGLHHSIYSEHPRGTSRPETNRALEALQAVVQGEMPLLFPAVRTREIARVLKLGREFKVKTIIAGGYASADLIQQLKESGTPVLIDLDFPEPPRNAHPEAEESLREIKEREAARKVASELHAAGVPFAFYGADNPREYFEGVRAAIEAGLPEEAALEAATLSAARILGVDAQLGSIAEGKIANLVLTNGSLFDEESQVRYVLVDGFLFDIPEQTQKPAESSEGDPTAQIDLTGSWDVTITAPGQTFDMTFDLTQAGSNLTGSITSPVTGSLSIYDGSVSGNTFSFKVQSDLGGGIVEITFSALVEENSFSGTATPEGIGPAEMEGRRIP